MFEPGRIGGLDVPNRIVKAPQATATCNADGTVTARTVNHYKRLGEGGVGLVLVEYSYIDDMASRARHAQIGISRVDHVPGLGWLADEVRATGARVGIQLAHCGRQRFLGTRPIKSASASSWDFVEAQHGETPTPMTVDEIEGVVASFGDAAARANAARFDLVEVHAGHGYLVTNFLSPFTNERTDAYGGAFGNRARLLLEIVDDIRSKVPATFPLSVRLSVTDYEPGGIPIEETVRLCRLLEDHGVDVIHASGGHHARMEWEVSPWWMPRAPHRWGWEQIKSAVSVPVIGSGSLVSPELADEIVRSGSADFVALGRPLLADPDWAIKVRSNRTREIVPCIRCNDGCLHRGVNTGRSVGCAVNPSVAEEGSYPILPAGERRTVAVVGGGPAGLRSAVVLHDRGHGVTLFEERELGGLLVHADGFRCKQDLAALRAHLVHEVSRRGIRVVVEHAGADALTAASFDTVVVATGSSERAPGFPVDAGVRLLRPADIRPDTRARGHVVVVGGGFHGCDTALRLTELPATSVTLVERRDTLLDTNDVFSDVEALPGRLRDAGVRLRIGTAVTAVRAPGRVELAPVRSAASLEADAVVLALGREAPVEHEIATSLARRGIAVVVVGSARREGRVMDALHDAFFTCRLL
jgi:2,4-dienoyl-CoA reductase-like NADH-dependent reductase (Old Yellow Enzyme family)/thioredoxin reductase